MQLLAHDPFISVEVAESLGVELVALDELCARADYISLHLPVTPETRHLFGAARLAACRPGVRLVNTARGELIDEAALAPRSNRATSPGPRSTCSKPSLRRLAPGLAAAGRRDAAHRGLDERGAGAGRPGDRAGGPRFLLDGIIRAAVNFPAGVSGDQKVQPLVRLAERLGALIAQVATGRTESVSIRYYGDRTRQHAACWRAPRLPAFCAPLLSSAVTVVNARQVAAGRGIEIIESRSSRRATTPTCCR
jgi:D-3-phosphoglycerate dehydrogenase / 2-oxoglutarate reductase